MGRRVASSRRRLVVAAVLSVVVLDVVVGGGGASHPFAFVRGDASSSASSSASASSTAGASSTSTFALARWLTNDDENVKQCAIHGERNEQNALENDVEEIVERRTTKKEARAPLISLKEYKADVEEKVAAKRANAEAKKKKTREDEHEWSEKASSAHGGAERANEGERARDAETDGEGDVDVVERETRGETRGETNGDVSPAEARVGVEDKVVVESANRGGGDKAHVVDKKLEDASSDAGEKTPELVVKSERVCSADAEMYNYAAGFNGAKVVASNKDSKHASAALKEDKDVYYISPCASDKFVTVELSEEATVTAIVLGNFEFHSSGVKDFEIWGTDGHHSNEEGWKRLMRGRAENVRELQKFTLPSPTWVHYVQIRILGTGHENQHFCTLSLLRVLGKDAKETLKEEMERMEAEVMEVEKLLSNERPDSDEDDDEDDGVSASDEGVVEILSGDGETEKSTEDDALATSASAARAPKNQIDDANEKRASQPHDSVPAQNAQKESNPSSDGHHTDPLAATTSTSEEEKEKAAAAGAPPPPSWIQRMVGKSGANKTDTDVNGADIHVLKPVNATYSMGLVIEMSATAGKNGTAALNATAGKNATVGPSSNATAGKSATVGPSSNATAGKNATVGPSSNATGVAPAKVKPPGVGSEISKGGGESVFRLLAQKIKDLELNQSLLSRYVESLNARYGGALEDFGKEFDEVVESVSNSTQQLDDATVRSLASSKTCDDAVARVSARAEKLVKSAVDELHAYRTEVAKRDTVLAMALALTAGALVASRRTSGGIERVLNAIASFACIVVCVGSILLIARAKIREASFTT